MFNIRKFDLVMALYIFGVMAAELMGSKTFPLTSFSWLHLNASVAIFVLPLLFTLTDVVVEVHGRRRARSMVWSGLFVVALLFLYSLLVTHLPPSHRFSPSEPAYDKIFTATARISLASLIAFAVSEFLDVAIFARLKERMHKQALWFRNNASNFISMFLDSFVFIFLAFYAMHESFGSNLSFLFGLIIPYWLIKCSLSVIETPLVYLGVDWLRGSKNPKVKPKET